MHWNLMLRELVKKKKLPSLGPVIDLYTSGSETNGEKINFMLHSRTYLRFSITSLRIHNMKNKTEKLYSI